MIEIISGPVRSAEYLAYCHTAAWEHCRQIASLLSQPTSLLSQACGIDLAGHTEKIVGGNLLQVRCASTSHLMLYRELMGIQVAPAEQEGRASQVSAGLFRQHES